MSSQILIEKKSEVHPTVISYILAQVSFFFVENGAHLYSTHKIHKMLCERLSGIFF